MKLKLLLLLIPIALSAEVPYPTCSGQDCIPQCGQNCAPPPVPCPQAGPPWCN